MPDDANGEAGGTVESIGGMSGAIVAMALYFSVISLTAVGGGVVMLAPDIHRYVVEVHGWISSEQFASAFTIAQASPGPNVLFVTLIGLQAAGIAGAIAATFAVVTPPFLLTLTLARFMPVRPVGRLGKAIRNGVAPISVGLLAAGGLVLARSADTGTVQLAITAATVAAMVWTRWNPVWLIAAGAAAGIGLRL
jgi:chromate transporter